MSLAHNSQYLVGMSSKQQQANWLGQGLVRNKDPNKMVKAAVDPPGADARSNGEPVEDQAGVAFASTEAGTDKEGIEALKKLLNTPSPKDRAMDAISHHIDDSLPKHLDPRHKSFKDPLYLSGKISLCDICGEEEGSRAGRQLLQCTTIVTGYHGCGKWFHVGCIRRDEVPDGDWICRRCSNAQSLHDRPVGDEGIELIPNEEDTRAFAAAINANEQDTVDEDEEEQDASEAVQDTVDEEEQDFDDDGASEDKEEDVVEDNDDDEDYVDSKDDDDFASDNEKKPAPKKRNKGDFSIDEEASDAGSDRKKRAERRSQHKERKMADGTYFDFEDSESDEEKPAKITGKKMAPSRKRAHVASDEDDVVASPPSKRSKRTDGKRRKKPTLKDQHDQADDDDDIGIECLGGSTEEAPRRAGSPARTIRQQNDSKVRVCIKQTQKSMENLMAMSRPLSRTAKYDKTNKAHRLKAKAEVGFPNVIHGTFCFQFQSNNECGSGQPKHLKRPALKMWTGSEHASKVVLREFGRVHKTLEQYEEELPFDLGVFDDFDDYHESFRGKVGKSMSKKWQRDHADDDKKDASED